MSSRHALGLLDFMMLLDSRSLGVRESGGGKGFDSSLSTAATMASDSEV